MDDEEIVERLERSSDEMMAEKAEQFGSETMRRSKSRCCYRPSTAKWRDHLLTLEHLRSVVGFRGYAQRDPLNEYKSEVFQLFQSMLDSLREEVTPEAQPGPADEEGEQREIMRSSMRSSADAWTAHRRSHPELATAGGARARSRDLSNPAAARPGATRGARCPAPADRARKGKHCHGRQDAVAGPNAIRLS